MNYLLELLRTAVRHALDDAEKVGIVCSGGLDSSTVACLAAEHGEQDLYTGFYRVDGFDERHYANFVPGRHHEVEITAQDFVDQFDNMAAALKPPWQGMGCLGQWMVARRMAEDGVTVCLSGEGADELFGGYARVLQVAGWPLPTSYPQHYRPPAGYPTDLVQALAWEMKHLDELLETDGRILAAHGIEGRAPFTNPMVERYALTLAPEDRVGKHILRQAVMGVVPQAIRLRRDKMGFPAPFVRWCQEQPMRSFVLDRIGHLPDIARPWDRVWWNELLDVTTSHLAYAGTE